MHRELEAVEIGAELIAGGGQARVIDGHGDERRARGDRFGHCCLRYYG